MRAAKARRDARTSPRVLVEEPAQVVSRTGVSLPATVIDVSAWGVGLRCSRTSAYVLHPSGCFIGKDSGPPCALRFGMRVSGQRRTIRFHGRVVHFHLVRETGDVELGVRFREDVDPETRALLNRFLEEAMCPA